MDERDELREIVRTLLAKQSGDDAWRTLCDQVGVTALPIPEQYDGAGASLAESAVALEEVAYALEPSPLLATTLAAAALLLHGTDEQQAELLPRIAAGETATVVLEPPLVLEPDARDRAGAGRRRPRRCRRLPRARRGARPHTPARPPRRATPHPRPSCCDVAAALATAVQLGTMRRGLDMTVAYSKERVQFGRPIGSFQALKHRMADLLVLVEMSRSASWAATDAAAAYVAAPDAPAQPPTLHRTAAAAKAYCSDALEQVAAETIQIHGGIGITWEHEAHLVFKRAHAFAQTVRHRARAPRRPWSDGPTAVEP